VSDSLDLEMPRFGLGVAGFTLSVRL